MPLPGIEMIHVVLGTKAQLIKMAPVMVRLRDRGVRYRLIHTGQHQATMNEMLDEFDLAPPDVTLHTGRDVVSLPQMAAWMARILFQCAFARKRIFGAEPHGMVLVHGDTFSTLLGALMGRVAGLRVGHVESGLRSFNWFHPFPEEITRLLTFRLSHTLYCPGSWAMSNVERYAKQRVDTQTNTLADTLALAPRTPRRTDHVPDRPFALASLHRYENIFKRKRFESLIETLEQFAETMHLLFILHPPTERQLERFDLRGRLDANPHIELRPRYTYFDFAALLEPAAFVITDGGSIQEESFFLGIPCLLMRRATERQEGLGANAVLSNYDPDVIRAFLEDPEAHRRPRVETSHTPSDRIVDDVLAQSDEGSRPA